MQREQFYLPLSILKKNYFCPFFAVCDSGLGSKFWKQFIGVWEPALWEWKSFNLSPDSLEPNFPTIWTILLKTNIPLGFMSYIWILSTLFQEDLSIYFAFMLFTWCSNGHNQSSGRSQSLYSHTRRAWWHFLSCSCPCGIGLSLCGWRQKYVSGICFEKWCCFPSQGFSYLST